MSNRRMLKAGHLSTFLQTKNSCRTLKSISQGTKVGIFTWDVTGKLKELSRGRTYLRVTINLRLFRILIHLWNNSLRILLFLLKMSKIIEVWNRANPKHRKIVVGYCFSRSNKLAIAQTCSISNFSWFICIISKKKESLLRYRWIIIL